MEKEQILNSIKQELSKGTISKNDILSVVGESNNVAKQDDITSTSSAGKSDALIKIFYTIGALIVIVGAVILVGQNWDEIGFVGRSVVTIGIALATFISGLMFYKTNRGLISQVMFLISAALSPLGVYVVLNESSIDFSIMTQFYSAIALSIVFGVALFIVRGGVLSLIASAFLTWSYYAIIAELADRYY